MHAQDGDSRIEDLPRELEAVHDLARSEVRLSAELERRVMAAVRRRALARGGRRHLAWWTAPREIRIAVRPWMAGAALAAAAAVLVFVVRPGPGAAPAPIAQRAESVFVRFELYAPGAKSVALAGSFNQWNAGAAPLVRVDGTGLWTVTVPLPPGPQQYGFVVDGTRWMPDPAAPAVDDGFGRKNSVIAVNTAERAL